jgi:tripartite-type tricarboxylate transporter receptor subunit TctC
MSKIHSTLLKAAALLLALTTFTSAQEYPTKPIRLIIPFPPGGSNDVVGRMIGDQLGKQLGKQVIIDNRAGAGGVIGTELASHATPDGYTILVISLAHAVNPWLYKLPYDPIKAFTPIGIMGTGTNVLTVHPSLPVNSLKEFLALAKEKPGELSYASAGIGTFQHLGAELFRLDAKVNLLHVPFRGGGPALVDVLGGHNKVMFSSLVQAVPHIKSGRLRALGTGGKERVPALADVPTISEAGVPGFTASGWVGIMAPAGTPKPIVDLLNTEINKILNSAEIKDSWAKQGVAPLSMTPAEFGVFIKAEIEKWAKVAQTAGVKLN